MMTEVDTILGSGEPSDTRVGNDAEEGLKPIISLHALLGTKDSQTMRLQGKIKNLVVIILMDTDSTHNFLDQNVVKRLGFYTQRVNARSVSVANGDKIWVTEFCSKVQWEADGVKQQIDCLVLPLKRCDMVLGIQ